MCAPLEISKFLPGDVMTVSLLKCEYRSMDCFEPLAEMSSPCPTLNNCPDDDVPSALSMLELVC